MKCKSAIELVRLVCLFGATSLVAIGPFPLWGNPSGGVVTEGTIDLIYSGQRLDIDQTEQFGIIDWDTFSIASNEFVFFNHISGPNSATLNRVTGMAGSQIDGSLSANGRIFLLNPNGVVIGSDGVIDTAGFTASTLDISNASFLAGGDQTFSGNSVAAVVNMGSISASEGDVFLIGRTVENSGQINAANGTVGLAAGNQVLIKESGSERVFVEGAGGPNGVLNSGTVEANIAELKAHGGNIYALAVNNTGRVAATGVSREGGQIFLRAGGGRIRNSNVGGTTDGTLVATRPNEAETGGAVSGGSIVVDAGSLSSIENTGEINASGSEDVGGLIVLMADAIDLNGLIIADGDLGGGLIRIGGGARGRDEAIHNADFITAGTDTVISANAGSEGNGGDIVLFAEDTLTFTGLAEAKGGTFSGDGGMIELSGQAFLQVGNMVGEVFVGNLLDAVDLSAEVGQRGTLVVGSSEFQVLRSSETTPLEPPSSLNAGNISDFLQGKGSLEIVTDIGNVETGNIWLQEGAEITWDSTSSLSIEAYGAFFTEPGGSSIIANGEGGAFSIKAKRGGLSLTDFVGRTVDTDIVLDGALSPMATNGSGVNMLSSQLSTQQGNIRVTGSGPDHGIFVSGILPSSEDSYFAITGEEGGNLYLDGGGAGQGVRVNSPDFENLSHRSVVGHEGMEVQVTDRSLLGSSLEGVSAAAFHYIYAGSADETGASLMVGNAMIGSFSAGPEEGSTLGTIAFNNRGNTIIGDTSARDITITSRSLLDSPETGNILVQGPLTSEDGIIQLVLRGAEDELRVSGLIQFDALVSAPQIILDGGIGGEFQINGNLDLSKYTFVRVPSEIEDEPDAPSITKVVSLGASDRLKTTDQAEIITVGTETESSFLFYSGGSYERAMVNVGAFDRDPAPFAGIDFLDFQEIDGAGGDDLFRIGLTDLSEQASLRFSIFGGDGADTFAFLPTEGYSLSSIPVSLLNGGSADGDWDGSSETLDYSNFLDPDVSISVNLGSSSATFVNFYDSITHVVGSSGSDHLIGTGLDDQFSIIGNASGSVFTLDSYWEGEGASYWEGEGEAPPLVDIGFSSFENLFGMEGDDTFRFTNQASIPGLIDGGVSEGYEFNFLEIDDTDLLGVNTYTLTFDAFTGRGLVSRNPQYNYTNIQTVGLLTGPGINIVNPSTTGPAQIFTGIGNFNAMRLQQGSAGAGVPQNFTYGSSNVSSSGFTAVLLGSPDNAGGESLDGQGGSNGGGASNPNALNQFNSGGVGGLPAGVGTAAFAAAVIGQAVVSQIDGNEYLIQLPASLDGTFGKPPEEILKSLGLGLTPDAFNELAAAIGFTGGMILVSIDGSWAIDQSGPAPAPVLLILGEGLQVDAMAELLAALGLATILPITNADGPVALLLGSGPPDPAMVALLNALLEQGVLDELNAALGNL